MVYVTINWVLYKRLAMRLLQRNQTNNNPPADSGMQNTERFNRHRNLVKNINTLLGICSGLIADDALNETEIQFLTTWLSDNRNVTETWPGSVIKTRVDAIVADGRITADEQADLLETLKSVCGTQFTATGAAAAQASTLPVQELGHVEFANRRFCLTGQFLYGTRSKCSAAIAERGGIVQDNITHGLDYLIIGALTSPDWRQTNFGTKIAKAVERQQAGASLAIISEESWLSHLNEATKADGTAAAGQNLRRARRRKRTEDIRLTFDDGYAATWVFGVHTALRESLDIRYDQLVDREATAAKKETLGRPLLDSEKIYRYAWTQGQPPAYGFRAGAIFYDPPVVSELEWAAALPLLRRSLQIIKATPDANALTLELAGSDSEGVIDASMAPMGTVAFTLFEYSDGTIAKTETHEVTQREFVNILRTGILPPEAK